MFALGHDDKWILNQSAIISNIEEARAWTSKITKPIYSSRNISPKLMNKKVVKSLIFT